jgi:transcriptional regulator with XRE-family HTH domain
MARYLDTSPSTLSRIERNLRRPRPELAERWAAALEELSAWS